MSGTALARLVPRSAPGRALAALLAVAAPAVLLLARRAPEAEVARVRRQPLEEVVVATGRVLWPAQAAPGVPFAGTVRAVHVDRGDRVRAGDVLAEVAPGGLAGAVEERRASRDAARARVAQLETTAAAAAEAALREAELAHRQAEADDARAAALREAGAWSAAEREAAAVALERARSRLAAARAAAADVAGAELRLARARAAEAQAGLAAAAARLAESRVVAPADGVVLERRAEPGDAVSPGRPLLVLALDGAPRVTIELDERHLARVRPGQRARVSAEAFPGEAFDAEVAQVGPGVDPARGTVEVRLGIPSPPAWLAPDMTVSVNVHTAARAAALVVPPEAVREGRDGARWCAAVARGGTVERRAVETGLRADGAVEIRAGLAEGDLVLVAPDAERLVGRAVRPREEG